MGGTIMERLTGGDPARTKKVKIAIYGAILLVVLIAPILFQGFGQLFMVRILAVVGLYVVLALGLNIAIGFGGLLDLGYIAYYAIGAYIGILGGMPLANWLGATFPDIAWLPGLSYFIMLPLAAAGGLLAGLLLGTPVLRLRGDYLAIVTLGFAEIVRIVVTNNIFGMTNGAAGLPRAGQVVPDPAGLSWLQQNFYFSIPEIGTRGFNFMFTSNVYWYYIIVLLCLFTIFVIRRLDDSRLGRSWTAMREDEVAAASMGVNIMGAKLWAFSLGAIWGAIAGATFANFQGFVSPESFTFLESVFVVCIVVLGGMGSLPGAIVGALVIQGVPELIRGFAASGIIQMTAEQTSAVSSYRYLIFGLLMVIMMAFRPQGIIPSTRRSRELHPESEAALDEQNQTLYDAEHNTATPGEDL
jgi:branched-chain amino acid transport system permease protein